MVRSFCCAGAWVSDRSNTGTPLKQVFKAASLWMNASAAALPQAAVLTSCQQAPNESPRPILARRLQGISWPVDVQCQRPNEMFPNYVLSMNAYSRASATDFV